MTRYGFVTKEGDWAHFDSQRAVMIPADAGPTDDAFFFTAGARIVFCPGGIEHAFDKTGTLRREATHLELLKWLLDRGMEPPGHFGALVAMTDEAVASDLIDPSTRSWQSQTSTRVVPNGAKNIKWYEPNMTTLFRFEDGRWLFFEPAVRPESKSIYCFYDNEAAVRRCFEH